MAIRLNATKVLIEDIKETKDKTESGIFIPTQVVQQVTMKGKIIMIGEGTPDIPIFHEVGAVALYSPRAGQKVQVGDKEYRLMDVHEILLSGV